MEQNERVQELKKSLLDLLGNAPLHELTKKHQLVVQPLAVYDYKRLPAEGSAEMEELKRRVEKLRAEGKQGQESIGHHTELHFIPPFDYRTKDYSVLELWFMEDMFGSYSDIEGRYPPKLGHSTNIISSKPVFGDNLNSGELDGELVKLLLDNPEFNPQLTILRKLCNRIAYYNRQKMHEGFLKEYPRQRFDDDSDQRIYSMRLGNFPSYLLTDNFSLDSVARFEGERDNYVRNAAILMNIIKHEFGRDYLGINLLQEDQDKLYEKDFDAAYFDKRKRSIGLSRKQYEKELKNMRKKLKNARESNFR